MLERDQVTDASSNGAVPAGAVADLLAAEAGAWAPALYVTRELDAAAALEAAGFFAGAADEPGNLAFELRLAAERGAPIVLVGVESPATVAFVRQHAPHGELWALRLPRTFSGVPDCLGWSPGMARDEWTGEERAGARLRWLALLDGTNEHGQPHCVPFDDDAKSEPELKLKPKQPEHDGERPKVYRRVGELEAMTHDAEDALLQSLDEDPLYQRSTELVRVASLPDPTDLRAGVRVAAHVPMIHPVAATWLRARFEKAAKFVKADGEGHETRIDCPSSVVACYRDSFGSWRLPRLTAIVQAPTMRLDGSVIQDPGLDARTGILFVPGNTTFPTVPESPTREDALAALAVLRQPVRAFPWCEPVAESVWIAAVLTALMRAVLESAPAHLFDSPVRGSGKTLLSRLVALITGGQEPSLAMHIADDDNEMRKRLFALLLRGASIIVLDNIVAPLGGASLCTMLSSPTIEDRVLGESRTATVSTRALLMATGNNMAIVGDLTRRVVLCRLDPQVERPEERRFDFDPVAYAKQHRPALVAAGLTILRAHAAAGWPATDLEPFGTFELWSERIRGPLTWLGLADPAMSRLAVQENDDEHETFAGLLAVWHLLFGPEWKTVGDLVATGNHELQAAIKEVVGDTAKAPGRELGKRLATERGRIYAGYRVIRADRVAHGGARRWRVEAAPQR